MINNNSETKLNYVLEYKLDIILELTTNSNDNKKIIKFKWQYLKTY